MKITRRSATNSDTELARQIHHRGYREIVERQYGPWDEVQQDRFFGEDWDPAIYEIVFCDAIPCGRISVVERGDAIILRDLVILPEYQNRGIGTLLLREIIEQAQAQKVPVHTGTHRLNRALNFYLRLGFHEVGQTPTHILLEARSGLPLS
jgi:GNAT superfamily N-acetyltransferase